MDWSIAFAWACVTGFKRRRAEFQDLLYQNMRRVGSNTSDNGTVVPSGAQVGLGVKTAAIYRINEQGNLQQTGNQFDMAINGNGFFQVQMPDGTTAYTRDGSFHIDAAGQLVNNSGFALTPAVTIPPTAQSVTIGADGTVSVTLPGQAAGQNVGTVQVAGFINPAGLESKGQNLFAEPGFEDHGLAWDLAIPPYEGAKVQIDSTVAHTGRCSMLRAL